MKSKELKLQDEASFCRLSGRDLIPAHRPPEVTRARHPRTFLAKNAQGKPRLAVRVIPKSSVHTEAGEGSMVFPKEPVNQGLPVGHAERK